MTSLNAFLSVVVVAVMALLIWIHVYMVMPAIRFREKRLRMERDIQRLARAQELPMSSSQKFIFAKSALRQLLKPIELK